MKLKRGSRGIGAIELILTFFLIGILSMAMVGVMQHINFMKRRNMEKEKEVFTQIFITSLIQNDLDRLIDFDFSESYPNQRDFYGDSYTFEFLTSSKRGELKRVRYQITNIVRDKEEHAYLAMIRYSCDFFEYMDRVCDQQRTISLRLDRPMMFTYGTFEGQFNDVIWSVAWQKDQKPDLIRLSHGTISPVNKNSIEWKMILPMTSGML